METYEYRKMYGLEDRLWWYRGLRLYFQAALRRANLPSDGAVLDAGCGTGANLVLLSRMFARTVGCDLAETAVALSAERGLKRVLVADVNHLPFKNGVFDCVLCSDVLECGEVDEHRAVSELARVTRTGARIILSAAAYEFLMSEHDRAVHAVRRYTKRRLQRAVSVAGVEIVAMRYLFGFFLVPIVTYRLLRRLRRRGKGADRPQSDLFLPPRVVNELLFRFARAEASLLSRFGHLPFGTTLLVEMKRTTGR
ncbi:MAG: hypothetical protein DMD96_09740 [Candidatus Rokuibacteriota bacterium]|nr:MAG: hypothetical protein DMD96_09740 [Candidatus Rokubacteria bacterium]